MGIISDYILIGAGIGACTGIIPSFIISTFTDKSDVDPIVYTSYWSYDNLDELSKKYIDNINLALEIGVRTGGLIGGTAGLVYGIADKKRKKQQEEKERIWSEERRIKEEIEKKINEKRKEPIPQELSNYIKWCNTCKGSGEVERLEEKEKPVYETVTVVPAGLTYYDSGGGSEEIRVHHIERILEKVNITCSSCNGKRKILRSMEDLLEEVSKGRGFSKEEYQKAQQYIAELELTKSKILQEYG